MGQVKLTSFTMGQMKLSHFKTGCAKNGFKLGWPVLNPPISFILNGLTSFKTSCQF